MISHELLAQAAPHALRETHLQGVGRKLQGKVRDSYVQAASGRRVLVATDRLSAFDRIIAAIPYKGQVLNQISAWWFEATRDVVANHVLAVPDPNVTIGAEAEALPVEVVVRGYITGVTDTSLWTQYSSGKARPYGLDLPAGLVKNDKLPTFVVTPTTKGEAGSHDVPVTSEQIVAEGILPAALWTKVHDSALEIFRRGTEVAAKQGMILVDTKYEFGLLDGELVLIDEVHTPDSSRLWRADNYAENHPQGLEPEGLDKEYVRRWLASTGYRGEGEVPPLPLDVVCELAARYIDAYERITGQTFVPAAQPPEPRIQAALHS